MNQNRSNAKKPSTIHCQHSFYLSLFTADLAEVGTFDKIVTKIKFVIILQLDMSD